MNDTGQNNFGECFFIIVNNCSNYLLTQTFLGLRHASRKVVTKPKERLRGRLLHFVV